MEPYVAPSEKLAHLATLDEPFEGESGEENLARVIYFLGDADEANRDWAAFTLALRGPLTEQVRDALRQAADDFSDIVRAEAIWGLAQRDRNLAIPLIKRELEAEFVSVPLFEAAELVADPSLADLLEPFTHPSGDKFVDDTALAAFRACKAAL